MRARLHDDASAAIRQYIIQHRLRPGDPLPSERQIQEQLGISRAPVREALRVLQSVGLIEARQGKGLFVKEMDLRPMIDTFVSNFELIDHGSFEDMFELRRMLELGAVELAAAQRNADDLAMLGEVVEAMGDGLSHHESIVQHDLQFHDLLVRAAHNPMVELLYSSMTPFLVAVRQSGDVPDHIFHQEVDEHASIFRAVRDQNTDLAVSLMQRHMSSIRKQIDTIGRR